MARERIACAAIAVMNGTLTTYIPVSTSGLVMDKVNELLRNYPMAATDAKTYFITTAGRVLDAMEAFDVAVNAHQLDNDTKVNGPLSALDIWPIK